MSGPHLAPGNQSAYRHARSAGEKVAILRRDFNATAPVSALSVIVKREPEQFARVTKWIPYLRTLPRFVGFVDAISPVTPRRSVRSEMIEAVSRLLYVAGGAFLAVSAVDLVLRGLSWSITEHTAWTDPRVYTKYLWVYDRERFDALRWAIPDVIFSTDPVPIVSFVSFSPAILIGALFVGLTYPAVLTRICVSWLVALAPIVWAVGVGAIPTVRLWALGVGTTCLVGAAVACFKSRGLMTHYVACASLFTANYWPHVRELLPDVRDEDDARYRANYSAELARRTSLHEKRNDSKGAFDAFLRAEAEANQYGESLLPGVVPGTRPALGQPTLAELIRRGPHQTTPAELASASGLSEHEARTVLRSDGWRFTPEHLRDLHEAMHKPGPL